MKKFRALSVIFAAMMLTSCSSKSGDADNSNIHLPVSPGLSSSSASDDNLETTPAVITEAAKKFKFGTVTDGVYKNQAEIETDVANGIIVPNAQPGDFRFKKFGKDNTARSVKNESCQTE